MSITDYTNTIKDYLVTDIETDGTDPLSSNITCYCFSTSEEGAIRLEDRANIQELLGCPYPLLGWNLKYELKFLGAKGYQINGPFEDGFILAQILQKVNGKYLFGKKKGAFKLKNLYNYIYNTNHITYDVLLDRYNTIQDKHRKKIDYIESCIPRDILYEYCKNDCNVTYEIFKYLLSICTYKDIRVYNCIEKPLIPILADMELVGIRVNLDTLIELEKQYNEELTYWKEAMWAEAGGLFNPNSVPQLKHIFYTLGKYPIVKKTKTGPSLGEEVLKRLVEWGFDLPFYLLGYRHLNKLMGMYIKKLQRMVNPKTGRIYCSFSQTGTETGRFSCKSPNLQQIPPAVKGCFVAGEGNVLMSADYSQIELRVLAHITGEDWLIKAFREGRDIHQEVADEFGIDRKVAKTINFGIVYGVTEYGLAQQAGIKIPEAREYIDKWFNKSPKVKAYADRLLSDMLKTKEKTVETMFGRTRRINFKGIWKDMKNPTKAKIRAKLWRLCINTLVQGTAADIVKMAMAKLYWKAKKQGIQMLLQVHDEFVFELPKDKVEAATKMVKEIMESVKLTVPVKVDVSIGKNWLECK